MLLVITGRQPVAYSFDNSSNRLAACSYTEAFFDGEMLVREEISAVVERPQMYWLTLKHFSWADDSTARAETRASARVHPPLRSGFGKSGRVPEHGEEMKGSPGNYEEMPGKMTVTKRMRPEEKHAARIGKTARQQ